MKQEEIEAIVNQILLYQQDKADKSATKTVSDLIGSLDAKISGMEKNFSKRLTELEANTKWISEALSGGRFLSRVSTAIMKFLVFVAAISGAIIWLKDWVKK